MTNGEGTRPPGTARGSGRIEVTASTKCRAPGCGRRLDEHRDAEGKQQKGYHVDGQPVGNADCAMALSAEPPCEVCGARGEHSCTRAARAFLSRLSVHLVLPPQTGEQVAR